MFFSLVLGMYEYRLGNIPLYVSPGHSIVYAAIYLLVRQPWMRRHAWILSLTGYALCAAFSIAWLMLHQDVYGFICFCAFSALIYAKRELRLFFVCMFLLVAYLELVGTHLECWFWPPALLDYWTAVPSGNPPSGISVFYMGFDIACLSLYKRSIPNLRPRLRRWQAMSQERAWQ